ncbi:MAG: HAMP domain-containing sensor histidine kinase [Clostridia bacterium]
MNLEIKILRWFVKFKNSDFFNKNSLFYKTYTAYVMLITVILAVTGMAFTTLIAKYALEDKTIALSNDLTRVKVATESIMREKNYASLSLQRAYTVEIMKIAEEANATVLISDIDGNVGFYYDPHSPHTIKTEISEYVVQKTLNEKYFSEVGDLYGFFNDITYTYANVIYNEYGDALGIVLIGMTSSFLINVGIEILSAFIIIMIIMSILIIVVSYFLTAVITKPLNEIAEVANHCVKGDYSYRVPVRNSYDEIEELTKNVNDIARQLSLSEQQRTTFLENVSHELKTPMTSISGFVDGILDGTIPEEKVKHYLDIVSEEAHRLSRLIARMLQTSKIHADNFTLDISDFDFNELVMRVSFSFEKKIVDKNIDFSIDLPSDNTMVVGDRENIYQVVYNLVDNAVKFTKSGMFLSITVKCIEDKTVFTIKNYGDTIPQEKIDNIFNRFYKVDSSRSEDTSGAGLGLYIARKIVLLHDSEINVTSKENITTFEFALKTKQKESLHE